MFLLCVFPSVFSNQIKTEKKLNSYIFLFLQSLARRSLRVDGERELVDDDDQHEDDSGNSGSEGDVPALDGSPGEGLGDSAGLGGSVHGHGLVGEVRVGRVNKLAARAVNAVLGIILESLDDSNVDQEGNDDGDGDQSAESNGNNTGQGHANSEDQLVSDSVEEEGEQEGQQDESGDQGHEDESLRSLGDVADVVRGLVVVEDGGGAASNRGGGLNSVQVVVDLGLVDGGGGGGQSASSSGGGGGGGLEVKSLLEGVPGSHGGGNHEGDNGGREDDGAAVTRGEGSRH